MDVIILGVFSLAAVFGKPIISMLEKFVLCYSA